MIARTRLALAVLILHLAAAACDSSSTSVELVDLTVAVHYPEAYAQSVAPGAEVSLRSLERGDTDTATTDASGEAHFAGVVPGSYEITAVVGLSEDDAFQLTGNRQAVELNAVVANHSVSASSGTVTLRLAGSPVGGWVISEMYYTGSPTPAGGNYFFDQFFEIHNNSTDTLYAGGLMLVNVFGPSGQINPGTAPTPFQDDQDHVHADAVWRIPGGPGSVPVAPGESLVIAQQGIDHRSDPDGNPNSPVDLGDADFEMYVDVADSQDLDNPLVPNMEMLHRRFGFYALVPVFGPAIALVDGDFNAFEQVPIPGQPETSPPVVRIPIANVLDAVEALQNENSGTFKRIPVALDAGFVYASGTYTSESVRRIVVGEFGGRTVYQDTNNSSNDFEISSSPNPGGP